MQTINIKSGILFIISAPSGAGKTSLVRGLTERDPRLKVSVSHTTRPRRDGEVDGIDYYFVDETRFREMADAGQFLEHAGVFDHSYGTSRQGVESELRQGRDVILEIDWQGAQQVRGRIPGCVSLFILPPDLTALEQRLRDRGEDQQTVIRRMRDARREISHYNEYDYLVVNDNFSVALGELEQIIRSMRHNYRLQQAYFDDLLGGLI